jgi:hypothetical protein
MIRSGARFEFAAYSIELLINKGSSRSSTQCLMFKTNVHVIYSRTRSNPP